MPSSPASTTNQRIQGWKEQRADVSRLYIDTNFLYGHLRQPTRGADPRFAAWRGRVISEAADDAPVISALVIDELAYRSILGWLNDTGDRDPLGTYRRSTTGVMRRMRARLRRLWKALDQLAVEITTTDTAVIARAQRFMAEPGLGPRDAFHAAHALEAGCEWIVSSDPDFDAIRELNRLGPGF